MSETPLRIFVENRADELIVQGILAEHVHKRRVTVRMCWDAGSIVSVASGSLLRYPAVPVALVFNCDSDPIEYLAPIERILSSTAISTRWHIALAVPDTSTWALADLAFADHWRSLVAKGRNNTRADQAVAFKEWCASPDAQFDLSQACRSDQGLAGLSQFIDQYVSSLSAA